MFEMKSTNVPKFGLWVTAIVLGCSACSHKSIQQEALSAHAIEDGQPAMIEPTPEPETAPVAPAYFKESNFLPRKKKKTRIVRHVRHARKAKVAARQVHEASQVQPVVSGSVTGGSGPTVPPTGLSADSTDQLQADIQAPLPPPPPPILEMEAGQGGISSNSASQWAIGLAVLMAVSGAVWFFRFRTGRGRRRKLIFTA